MSIRTKQALILLLATVLPFAMGAAAVALVVAPAYERVALRAAEEHAERLAEHTAWNLARDISRLERLAAWVQLRRLVMQPPVSDARARELDGRWARLTADTPELRELLDNLVSRELRWWQETDANVLEIFVTNARGYLVAASVKTTDFIQSDEYWWQTAYARGGGRVFISDVLRDAGSSLWAIEIAVPVHADAGVGSAVVGVMKMTLDAPRAFQDVQRATLGQTGQSMLVNRMGRVVVSPEDGPGLSEPVRYPELPLLRRRPSDSGIVGRGDAADLYAWAQVPLMEQLDLQSARVPTLFVVTRRSTAEVFGPLRIVHRSMLGIGIVTIFLAVVLGYWLADRLVVRPIRLLAAGMRELAQGDFQEAERIAERLVRVNGAGREPEQRAAEPLPRD
jgi:hypothetical protein